MKGFPADMQLLFEVKRMGSVPWGFLHMGPGLEKAQRRWRLSGGAELDAKLYRVLILELTRQGLLTKSFEVAPLWKGIGTTQKQITVYRVSMKGKQVLEGLEV